MNISEIEKRLLALEGYMLRVIKLLEKQDAVNRVLLQGYGIESNEELEQRIIEARAAKASEREVE